MMRLTCIRKFPLLFPATPGSGLRHRRGGPDTPSPARRANGTRWAAAAILVVAGLPGLALAAEPTVSLTLKQHRFEPSEVTIPADTRVRILVRNLDATPAEFESDDFRAEKVIPAGKQVAVLVGPLKAGTYEFHDEYHEAESKSRLIVK